MRTDGVKLPPLWLTLLASGALAVGGYAAGNKWLYIGAGAVSLLWLGLHTFAPLRVYAEATPAPAFSVQRTEALEQQIPSRTFTSKSIGKLQYFPKARQRGSLLDPSGQRAAVQDTSL